jgi:hemolysin D
VLIEFDSTLAQAAVDSAQKSLDVATLERDVLKKIDNNEDPSNIVTAANVSQDIKDDLLQLTKSKQSAVTIRQQLLSISISQAQSEMNAAQQTEATLATNLAAAQNLKQQTEQQLAGALSDSDRISLQAQLRNVTDQIASLSGQLTAQKQQVAQLQSGVDQANTNLQSYNSETESTNLSNVVDQDKKIADLQDALVKAKKALEQQTLTAPVDGTVLSLATKTVGGVATPAQALITIVPNDAPLLVEADISTSDIGFIKTGQKVAIKVDTFSFQRYGYLNGTVKSISADTLADDKKGVVYKARVSIDTNKTSKDNSIQVIPGMTVTSEITTGQRKIIEFFLDPLITHVDESLKVR